MVYPRLIKWLICWATFGVMGCAHQASPTVESVPPVEEKISRDQEGYGKYEEPDDSDFDEPSKTKKLEGKSTYKQIMEM